MKNLIYSSLVVNAGWGRVAVAAWQCREQKGVGPYLKAMLDTIVIEPVFDNLACSFTTEEKYI